MKKLLIIGIPVIAILALVGWRMQQKDALAASLKTASKANTTGPLSVDYAVAGPREINQVIDAVGTIQAPYTAMISPKIQGLITQLDVREGDTVRAGQVLVKLDPDTISSAIAQNQANVANAQYNYAKTKITQNSNDVSVRTGIEQQNANVSTAQANLNQVTQNLAARLAAAKAAVTDSNAKIAQAQANLASAKANLQSAKANRANDQTQLNRDLELYKQNYIAAQDVDNAKTTLAVGDANVNVAQKGVAASQQMVKSAIAERDAAQNQYDITVKQADADIATAKAGVNSAKAGLKYAVSNKSQTPAYQAQLDALKAAVDAAKSQLHATETQLADTSLSSPFDGTVTARAADPGTMAQPGVAVLTVQNLKWVYLNVAVPVEQSHSVFVGQQATATIDALPGKTFGGSISQVDLSSDPTSHQFVVLVKFDNPDLVLRPGMYGHVDIIVGKTPAAVVVPREAVTTAADNSTTVVIAEPDATGGGYTAKVVPVKLGVSDALGYQILDGVKAGDRVVSLTYTDLKDGRAIRLNGVTRQVSATFSVDVPELPNKGSSGGHGNGARLAPPATSKSPQ